MFRVALLGVAGTCLAAATILGAPRPPARPRTPFVELGAVVVDDDGQLVRHLRQEDFRVQEDGHQVQVTSFTEVSAAGITDTADGRSVLLLLDDTGIGAIGTEAVQSIAKLFMSRARPADDVAAVRLTHSPKDEAVGDISDAFQRIAEYRGGTLPYFGWETTENALKAVTAIARQVEPLEHRRKVLVCVGARSVCDPYLPIPEDSMVWSSWLEAIRTTARADLSVYVVDPSGVRSEMDLGDGLVEATGGTDFVKSNNFARAVDLIWAEAGHYYLLGYTPTARARDLHTIDVKMRRKGLHARARNQRGD